MAWAFAWILLELCRQSGQTASAGLLEIEVNISHDGWPWVPGAAPENAWEGGFSSAAREIPCELAGCLRFLWLAEATFLSRRSCARTPEPFARPIFSLKVRDAKASGTGT